MLKRNKCLKRKLRLKWKTLDPLQKQGLGLMTAGLMLMIVFGLWRIRELTLLSFKGQGQNRVNHQSQIAGIKIKKVGLDLEVEPAIINDGSWEISAEGASHWSSSANPGEMDNIVIYGHNKTNLFGPIRWVNTGEVIELTDKQGRKYSYKIVKSLTTNPDDIQYVMPTREETLTLYTCTGWLDRQRYVVIAKPDTDPMKFEE